jgi:hypothetical protein
MAVMVEAAMVFLLSVAMAEMVQLIPEAEAEVITIRVLVVVDRALW